MMDSSTKAPKSAVMDVYPLLTVTPLPEEEERPWHRRLWRQRPSRSYLLGFLTRLATLVTILVVLIAIGLGLRYTDDMPQEEDFSHLEFNWRVDPSSYLIPYNQSFQYNILLDGHAHSTYSDGKMNVKQLLDWHIGKNFEEQGSRKEVMLIILMGLSSEWIQCSNGNVSL